MTVESCNNSCGHFRWDYHRELCIMIIISAYRRTLLNRPPPRIITTGPVLPPFIGFPPSRRRSTLWAACPRCAYQYAVATKKLFCWVLVYVKTHLLKDMQCQRSHEWQNNYYASNCIRYSRLDTLACPTPVKNTVLSWEFVQRCRTLIFIWRNKK